MTAFRLVLAGLVCIGAAAVSSRGSAQAPVVYNICRGEFEALCKRHPYDRFERCGTYGVNGANPGLSCKYLCGKSLGADCQSTQNAQPVGGNACGYAWFKITCGRAP